MRWILGSQWTGLLSSIALCGIAAVLPAQGKAKKKPTVKVEAGDQLFRTRCSGCHGVNGQGGTDFSGPLTGTKSRDQLEKYVRASMPPDGPKLSATEAKAVSRYVFDAFYSPIAVERNRPARVTVSRLTVRQFRNAVADLIGPYHAAINPSKQEGLRGQYYNGRNFDDKIRVIDRVDPVVKFDFGTNAPAPQGFDAGAFSINWQGSLIAPETGEYEFTIRSDQAVRMWLNGWKKPFIDAWVKSGTDTEFRGVMNLVGGRAYPLRLEFSKAKQGVDDKKKTAKPVHAFVQLNWRRPKLAEEPIPTERLSPAGASITFVPDTPFPPDDRSIGYERGNSVSKAWDEATTTAALDAANRLVANLNEFAGIPDDAANRPERIKSFAKQFVERAFRRPLSSDVEKLYIDKQFDATSNPELALKRVVTLTLKSPRFLYRTIGDHDPYAIAEQLSFGLWDTLPDPQLLRAATDGRLNTPEQVAAQAERMANDPRAWTKLREFLLGWLRVDEVSDLVKGKRYSDFDVNVATDLRTSLELFLKENAAGPDADYRRLILSTKQFLNGRLAKVYGVDLPPDSGFRSVDFEPESRAGVVTHPYLLARFAYLDGSSPIHRGVLIARSLLGRKLQPPPAAFAPLPASVHPNLTTRERVTLQTKPPFCYGCHGLINPLGFTLERFDAIGRKRDVDGAKPVDTTAVYKSGSGKVTRFNDAVELAKYIANSDEAHAAFVEKLFQHIVKQPILAYGKDELPTLVRDFEANNYNIRKLMVRIITSTALSDLTSAK